MYGIDLYDEKAKTKLLSKIKVVNNCWVFTGDMSFGYGRTWYKNKHIQAHRLSYLLFNGELNSRLVIDHLCRNKACVNPEHLEQVTQKENVYRGFAPTAINARKTHCIHGHSLSGYNLIIREKEYRQCRKCKNIWMHNYRKRGKIQ